MYGGNSSPNLSGRSPKLPGSPYKGSNFSPAHASGKVDPAIEMERLERDMVKITQVCR